MKTLMIAFVLTLFFGGAVAANAQRTETARIKINNSKRLPNSRISIRFLELVEDSRCPTGVQCIQAGVARIKIEVRGVHGPATFTVDTNGKAADVQGFRVSLTALTPAPANNIRINRNGYVATFVVSRISR